MFTNLSQNSILYILETKDRPKLSTGTVFSVSLPRPKYATFGQSFETVMDITADVRGERREFKGIPCNSSIANFGPDAFVLADSRESMNSHVSTAYHNNMNIVNGFDKIKSDAEAYLEIMEELNPSLRSDKEKDKAIQSLQTQLSELKDMIAQMAKAGEPKTK